MYCESIFAFLNLSSFEDCQAYKGEPVLEIEDVVVGEAPAEQRIKCTANLDMIR